MNWQSLKTFISSLWPVVIPLNAFSRLILPAPILALLSCEAVQGSSKLMFSFSVTWKRIITETDVLSVDQCARWYWHLHALLVRGRQKQPQRLEQHLWECTSISYWFWLLITSWTHTGGHCLVQGIPHSWCPSLPVDVTKFVLEEATLSSAPYAWVELPNFRWSPYLTAAAL